MVILSKYVRMIIMNKNKGIWLVIAAILLIGIAVTFATSRFIFIHD